MLVHRRSFVTIFAAALFGMAGASVMPALPAAVAGSAASPLVPVGEARLTKYAFHIYDARLWAEGGRFDPSRPHALEIRYAQPVTAATLTKVTLDEWRKLGLLDTAHERKWTASIARAWPDIEPGDTLIAYAELGEPMRIFHNGKVYSEFDDPEFASAFLAIWLDPRSSEPKLRRKLLGLASG